MENYYNDLNLPVLSPIGEVKKAYRNLAKRFHPDKNMENHSSVQSFLKISKAYEFLKDTDRKKNYDNKLIRFNKKTKIQHDPVLIKEYIKKTQGYRYKTKIIFGQKIMQKEEQCEKCEGYGRLLSRFSFPDVCPGCGGTGRK